MSREAKVLLGHWLGNWGAWALNGNGVVAYPHQLQAVEWIRPDGKAYLLGDEVGLGKTFTAALLWMRHQQLYGEKARLLYITKPSLIVDGISAFVSVLGVDEFLRTDVEIPQKPGELHPRFGIFHGGTACWEMVADEDGRKRNKDHHVESLIKEGRYRVRPKEFRDKIRWLRAVSANKLHDQININAVKYLLDNVYTFVSIDTLRNPEQPLQHVFEKLEQASLVPLVIVDESHGLGRDTKRRRAIADLLWGPPKHTGKPAISRIPGALVVFMTGTPVHPNKSETASRLGLLDHDQDRTPHALNLYETVDEPATRAILSQVRERAVIRRKESITLNGKADGVRIFPKRLVFPFQRWFGPTEPKVASAIPENLMLANKDVLLAIDQYVASEASHGAKLVSLIRRVLRDARDWPLIKQVVNESEAAKKRGTATTIGQSVLSLAIQQQKKSAGAEQKRWCSLRLALEASQVYEEKLKDDRLENLTWKRGMNDEGLEERQLLFTKVGWVATAYDSLAKGGKKAGSEPEPGEVPDEDEETAGELPSVFASVDEMLKASNQAMDLARAYLEPVKLDDPSKVRFSMLVALLEEIATLKLWPKKYPTMGDEDRFGWGVDDADTDRLREAIEQIQSEQQLSKPWVVHARYIHSVVDTAVRLELRYGRQPGSPIVGIIIGDTPNSKRDEIKERFSKGELNVVCMSDAGAEGINLQRSSRIVLLDVPVSPGRIEQIAGRVHRLGSTKAAQVTLLLPPEYFGTKVFEALRKAASNVFKQVTGSNLPNPPESGAEDDSYYVRQLADYEACLLTAVAQASGAIRSEENRGAIERLVRQPELDGKPNTAPIQSIIKNGFELIEEQRARFEDQSVATHSDLMPEIGDLVDALVRFEEASTSPTDNGFQIPTGLIEDRSKPDQYGDLVTCESPFQVLHLNKKRYWYGPKRFLPSDVPQEAAYQWLGVIGNPMITSVLSEWRRDQLDMTEGEQLQPRHWLSVGLPVGKAIGFCGVTNDYKADGSPAVSPSERQLHVMVGFIDCRPVPLDIQWRPFYARGESAPRSMVGNGTWLSEVVPDSDDRWGARLIRRVTGLDHDYDVEHRESGDFASISKKITESVIRERTDEDEGTTSWRLQKHSIKSWLDANAPNWWAGGSKLGCKPNFMLIAFGESERA